MTSASAWVPGQVVGRYRLLAPLAEGGMAEVWLAKQTGLEGFEKIVALKSALRALSGDANVEAMFLDEARMAAALQHPNIVQVLDLAKHGETYYIAMEYLEGRSVADLLKHHAKRALPLPFELCASVVASAAGALGYAHARTTPDGQPMRIVHRDVSPQNLFVTSDGMVKVLDFGIARATTRVHKTMQGEIKGKLAYMAPEQAASRTIDGRSDLFALGVVLFELVTLTRLFTASDPAHVLDWHAKGGPLPLASTRNPEVPPALDALIARAIERDPARRFQNGGEMQRALEGFASTLANVTPATLSAYLRETFPDVLHEQRETVKRALAQPPAPAPARRVTSPTLPATPVAAPTSPTSPATPATVARRLTGERPGLEPPPAATRGPKTTPARALLADTPDVEPTIPEVPVAPSPLVPARPGVPAAPQGGAPPGAEPVSYVPITVLGVAIGLVGVAMFVAHVLPSDPARCPRSRRRSPPAPRSPRRPASSPSSRRSPRRCTGAASSSGRRRSTASPSPPGRRSCGSSARPPTR